MVQQSQIDAQKKCPRCREAYACNASNIGICQCSTIHLSKEQSQYISQQYTSCLCINCLQALQQEFEQLILSSDM